MQLYEVLQRASSEEDVKDAYIKALGLKAFQKNLIDIQTKEIWFEAKDNPRSSSYAMFTQLLHYVQHALDRGEEVPPFLAVIDTQKAAIMRTQDVLPLLEKKDIKWGKSASQFTQDALERVSAYIGAHIVSFKLETHEEEFINTVKNAIKTGEIIRTQITPDNLKQVFDKWVELIGKEVHGIAVEDYSLLFFADIMHDGTVSAVKNLPAELLHKDNAPCFFLRGKLYELNNKEGYRRFWSIYHKPPKSEYRNYLLERRDSLIPIDERSFKGAYYTPLAVVDKAYDKLTETLGENWQKEYVVWDMCCGVGNLEVKHSNPRNIFMSTLDIEDVEVMKATKTCPVATRFQYDYLNDDITEDGNIDYSLTNKVPEELREAIKKGKKILVLMNPPYAEAGNTIGKDGKGSVSKTRVADNIMNMYGKAKNELFTQFLARILIEIPNAEVAMFSKLKYVNAPNFELFRNIWSAEYLGGFIVHSKSFEGLKGEFPIGFLVWDTGKDKKFPKEIETDVYDKNAKPIGVKKFFASSENNYLNSWITRKVANVDVVIPLKGAVTVATNKTLLAKWSDNALAYLWCKANDMQNAQQTVLVSSTWGDGHGYYVNSSNLECVAVIYAVRRMLNHTWQNDRDQFLQPDKELTEDFKNDCLVWMLFNGSNLTASADDLEWNGKKWSIINHFIPFTEEELHAPDRFASHFMIDYLADKKLSTEAVLVMEEAKKLWQSYFEVTDVYSVRDELKLNRPDVGWYQIRKSLQARNKSGDYQPVSFSAFEDAYLKLTEKLRPQVYEFGFLK